MTVPVPDLGQPAPIPIPIPIPIPAPSATAAGPQPSEQVSADYSTAEDDHPAVPDPRPDPISTLPVTEPAEILEPTAHARGGDHDQEEGDDLDGSDDQDGGERPGD